MTRRELGIVHISKWQEKIWWQHSFGKASGLLMSRSSRIYRLVVVAHCVYPTRYQEDFIMLDGHNLTHVIQCCEEKYQTMLNKSCLFNDTIAPDRTDASRTNSSITIARGVRLRSSIFCQLRDMKQLLLFFNTTKIHQFLILSNLS